MGSQFTWPFVSGLFYPACCFRGSSALQQLSVTYSSLRPSDLHCIPSTPWPALVGELNLPWVWGEP